MGSSWGSLPSRTSPKGGQRACLCKDGKSYSIKCCNGSLHAQGIGVIDGTAIPIVPIFPSNTIAPVISGTTTLGSVLTSTTGTWTGNPSPTFAYEWYRNGLPIFGATSSTYTLMAGDSNANINCAVDADNALGTISAVSNTITAGNYSNIFRITEINDQRITENNNNRITQ